MFTLKARPYTLRVGSLVAWDRNELGVVRNTLGTFTFTNLVTYEAGRPASYTQRVGAQTLAFSVGQAATFVQAEFTKARWNLAAGARYEWQTGIDDRAALAPRLGVSRGFRRNTTNVRAGYGWFYGWMPARIEEETRRLASGSTEEEIVIQRSGISRPLRRGDSVHAARPADPVDSCGRGRAAALAAHVNRDGSPDPAGPAPQRRRLLRTYGQRLPGARPERPGRGPAPEPGVRTRRARAVDRSVDASGREHRSVVTRPVRARSAIFVTATHARATTRTMR